MCTNLPSGQRCEDCPMAVTGLTCVNDCRSYVPPSQSSPGATFYPDPVLDLGDEGDASGPFNPHEEGP